ncbi:hypothetical protein F5050DRAFT_1811150 [Lentinula boryana]|uniref:Rad4-domain-containing protein n=1 Tax=Lentinula boryana TaxID=40481 RepID=A0ABQ8Q261_9AGAR|nr:hypothetical protein F5050DRAFT_1811150 [Lentinula boryana]
MSSPYDDNDNDNDLAPLSDGFNGNGDDSDDEMDWEEVQVYDQEPKEQQPLMKIVLRPDNEVEELSRKKLHTMSHAERMLRIDCHKIHTVLLLINARIRNKWLNDELLHARLLSLTPLALQNSFAMIHSSKVPEAGLRGRMFENSVSKLVEWWSLDFFEVNDEGHIRNIIFDAMNQRLAKFVHGFQEQFDAAVAPPESDRDDSRLKLKAKGKGKEREKEKQLASSSPLIDSSDLDLLEDILDNSLESINSPKSLMKHALMQSGSRDTSAQLFTALCRALSIPARLVVSLQSVPWKAAIGREAKKYSKKVNGEQSKGKGKAKEIEMLENEDNTTPVTDSMVTAFKDTGQGRRLDDRPIEKSEKAKGKEKAKPPVKLRKAKSKGNVLGSPATTGSKLKKIKHDDPRTTPPTYWTEVFSKADSRWIPVDPIRGFVNKRHVFDPSRSSLNSASPSSSGDNRLVYVIAFEEDGFARDVTRRYAREYSAKVAKVQGGSTTGTNRARTQWWEGVLGLVTRPFRLNRDDIEDEEFETAQLIEGMPTSMTGFKDHPLYVLTRHLKQNETIYPPPGPALGTGTGASTPRNHLGSRSHTPELGKFRGEPVYPRSSVVSLKTPENWLRSEGRSIREGEVPMKYVKLRASTIGRRREIEMIKEGMKDMQERTKVQEVNGVIGIHVDELGSEERAGTPGRANAGGEIMQGLYARNQTELYVPDPVIDGIVPKNQFGNIDLYVETMLPKGAVHMPFKGVAKIARKLHIDFAEAVIGFEFRKRRAMPVLEGIVVAAENEEVVHEAFLEAEREALEKAQLKKKERVIKQWTRLVHGLRIRQRLQEQYADRLGEGESTDATTRTAYGNKNKEVRKETKVVNKADEQGGGQDEDALADNSKQSNDEDEGREENNHPENEDVAHHTGSGGGFLVQAGDVVQPFRLPRLPKMDRDLADYSALGRISSSNTNPADGTLPAPDFETYDIEVMPMDVDEHRDEGLDFSLEESTSAIVPKTMQDLAQADGIRAVNEADNLENIHDGAPATRSSSSSGSQTMTISAKEPTGNQNQRQRINGKGRQDISVHRKSARSSTRKRKRRQEDSHDDVSDEGNEDAGQPSSSPVKRMETTTSTRVLRSHTKAKVQ